MAFERRASHNLPEADFQLLESVQRHLVGEIPVDDSRQAKLVEADLDGDLPKARQADEAIVRLHHRASFLRELGAVLAPPEKRVGVEQDRQFTYTPRNRPAAGRSRQTSKCPCRFRDYAWQA